MTVGRSVLTVCAAVVTAIILVALGFTWPFVIGWSLLVCALGAVAQLVVPLEPSLDAPRIAMEPERRPTEISRMAWALNTHTGVAGQQITRRVRGVLRDRLARRGIDPEDPTHRRRMVELIGPDLWDRLSGASTTIVDIERALDAIDDLSAAPVSGLPSRGQPDPTTDRGRRSSSRTTRR